MQKLFAEEAEEEEKAEEKVNWRWLDFYDNLNIILSLLNEAQDEGKTE